MSAALNRRFTLKKSRLAGASFVWGGIVPDLGIYLVSIAWWAYYGLVEGWSRKQIFSLMYDDLFFNNPIWIFSYNILHSPMTLGIMTAGMMLWFRLAGTGIEEHGGKSGFYGYAGFLTACWIHAVIDILTHHDDGALLLYPFNLEWRFVSPVSYWDVNYFAQEFFIFETALNILFAAYLITTRMKGRV